jgi:hypothetical protein
MNHAVQWVRDAGVSADFCVDVLFEIGPQTELGAAGTGQVGLYHPAWEVPTLADVRDYARRLRASGALARSADHGTTKGLYAKDPDGLDFEVCWLVPADLIDEAARGGRGELDLDADIARHGACARVGV